MRSVDRWVGAALAVLAAAVLWSARAFPVVPGQKVGAGFLPTLVGLGLLVCGLALVARSRHAPPPAAPQEAAPPPRLGAPLVVVASVLLYVFAADRLGFLVVAPLSLLMVFFALGVRPGPALLWALGGTVVVHLAFYKLLRVPLPWGVFRPFY